MSDIINQFIKTVIKSGITSPEKLAVLKRTFSRENKVILPTNIILLKEYNSMVKNNEIKRQSLLEDLLRVRRVRSQSGVAVVAVLTKDFGCPGKCLYCPSEKGMPKSYLSNEPAVMRAIANDFDPYRQVQMRLEGLEASGHPTDKVELIIIGGTFGSIPNKYRYRFITECFSACNENSKRQTLNAKLKSPSIPLYKGGKSNSSFCKGGLGGIFLKQIQKKNETAKHRIVGITIETRPDYINKKEIIKLRELGVTRVELGVQSIYDDVLKINKRGHNISQTIEATRLLKDAGFKINYHMMPNLPGSSISRDKKMFRELFENENFQPDILKIYPTVVTKNSELYKWWKRGKFKPYSDKQLLNLLINIKKNIPPYVRIMRLIRDIPAQSIVAGSKISNLRQIIEQKTRENLVRCRCIRCREIKDVPNQEIISSTLLSLRACQQTGEAISNTQNLYKNHEIASSPYWSPRNDKNNLLKLIRRNYDASNGKEIFLSFEDAKNDKLYALLRLRMPSSQKHFIPALNNAAIIREVHTYGQLVPIAQKGKKNAQHIGLGKQLIAEAERIAREEFKNNKVILNNNKKQKKGVKSAQGGPASGGKIAVISGVGVRNYYRKLGYRLKNEYMIKNL